MKKIFHTASDQSIKDGRVSDVYFSRGVEILKKLKADKEVSAEIRASTLPHNWEWAIFAGLEELLGLFEGIDIEIEAIPEGTFFYPDDPIITINGNYLNFAVYETALLGLICQASGVATKAARCRHAAKGRKVYSFGARRMHPSIAPMIERNAFIGGCDGVAAIESAELIGEKPIGTMSHSLILTLGDEVKAYKAFDKIISSDIGRVALIDTFQDEKFAAIEAAEALGKHLFAVRLDTPGSRKGDFLKILKEVRWELDLRGFDNVKIFISGGLDEHKISELNQYADAYGVGTAISNADVIDFSMDIVEVEGKPLAKRGKLSGRKQLLRCGTCFQSVVIPRGKEKKECNCGGELTTTTKVIFKNGKINLPLPKPQEIRKYVLSQMAHLSMTL